MIALVAAAAVLAADVLAIVNGQPITRAELARALSNAERQSYEDAAADLKDAEHAAVRDYLGRQAVDRETRQQRAPADSIYGRVLAADFEHFDANLRNRIQQQRERVFDVEQAALERLVQQRLFEAAARARGQTPEELNRALAGQVAPATHADLEFIKAYEASKQQISATVPPGEGRLAAAIHDARIEQMRMAVIDSVRRSARVETRLAPPRVAVPDASATRVGSAAAAIRIVVFTDFECPYCLEGEQVLSQIRRQYGDRVAVDYFNYPLPSHPHARDAAIAASCAAAQGKYAAYHDLLFAHSEDLAHADYGAWAASLGLDRAAFEACRTSGEAGRRVDQDIREGIAAGVGQTPTFLVNGRLVKDSEELQIVVAQEAAAK